MKLQFQGLKKAFCVQNEERKLGFAGPSKASIQIEWTFTLNLWLLETKANYSTGSILYGLMLELVDLQFSFLSDRKKVLLWSLNWINLWSKKSITKENTLALIFCVNFFSNFIASFYTWFSFVLEFNLPWGKKSLASVQKPKGHFVKTFDVFCCRKSR